MKTRAKKFRQSLAVASIIGSALIGGGCKTTQNDSAPQSSPAEPYVVFPIELGSRTKGNWNTPDDPVVLQPGQSLVLINADDEPVGTWVSAPDCPIAFESCNSLAINEIPPNQRQEELGRSLTPTGDKVIGVKGRYHSNDAPCLANEQPVTSEKYCESSEPVFFVKVVE